ncbi:MAG: Prolipoprotein diacylglyceryl transferase [Chloroflexi bacterium]|nr:Prolipoprotein diacylglyceryl transferase [Chloroflexota bacterium]
MFPTVQIGPLSAPTPGLILLFGIWLGITLAERLAPRFNVAGKALSDIVFAALLAGILGARLAYAVQSLPAFLDNPLSLFSLTPNMLDPVGGLLLAAIVAFFYGRHKKLALWPTLDALTPFLATLGIALGLAHLASGDAYGVPTTLPWGIFLWEARRHPTQIYEILGAGLTLALTWPSAETVPGREGKTFGCFTALTAAAHLIIHGFRGDSTILANGIRLEQVIALVILGISLWWLGRHFSDPNEVSSQP